MLAAGVSFVCDTLVCNTLPGELRKDGMRLHGSYRSGDARD